MKIIAPAKLNLYLHITGRRDDGYHLLDSLFAFTTFGDAITVTPSSSLTLTIDGPFSSAFKKQSVENNLVFRAALLLKNEYAVNTGAHIHLTKNIPISAGLGGGSSDAATILKALNNLWELQSSNEELANIGLSLGADIPACLYQKTALISGIGEQIKPIYLPFQSMVMLLVNPNLPLSTQTVFKQYHQCNAPFSSPVNADLLKTPLDCAAYHNDLEPPAMTLLPVINDLIQFLKEQNHCLFARMSGSGPTCFGLFSNMASAELAQQHFSKKYTDLWTALTPLKH